MILKLLDNVGRCASPRVITAKRLVPRETDDGQLTLPGRGRPRLLLWLFDDFRLLKFRRLVIIIIVIMLCDM